MAKDASAVIVVVIIVVLLGLMAAGWYARKRRQAHIGLPEQPPTSLEAGRLRYTGKYVATTIAGDRLNRVNVHGLGFRAVCELEPHPSGIVVRRAGAAELWIAASNVQRVDRATWTIDRVVEPNGLHVIEWTLNDIAVDSYFRMDDPEACDQALERVVADERQPQ